MRDFFRKHKIKKSFRVVIFFIAIICLSFGGYTVCKLLFDGNNGSYWDGSVATSFASGTGTQANPYIVSNASQFAYLQNGCKNNVYIRLNNDIYLNEGDIEKEEDNYYLYVGNDKYNLDIDTGVATKGLSSRTLQKYNSTTNETSCHIDGNNHTVYGLYIQNEESASFLHNFTGTIDNIYFQSSLVSGATASLIKNTQDSTYNDIYFDGIIASSIEEEYLYNTVKNQSIGSSNTINYNVSSQYAENNYNSSSGYAYRAGVYQFKDDPSVYFYRGSVTNNNVIFGGFCWKIIRTTSTGGTKLIYNGTPDNNGACPTTFQSIGTSPYNNANDRDYTDDPIISKYVFKNSLNIDTDSTVKSFVDNWYSTNLIRYSGYIEDTPYCNNYEMVDFDSNKIGYNESLYWFKTSYNSSYYSINVHPNLSCRTEDSYTVSSSNGNGKLTYPIGLLTSEELVMAGFTSSYNGYHQRKNSELYQNNTNYLASAHRTTTMTPAVVMDGLAGMTNFRNSSIEFFNVVDSDYIKPVISLNHSAVVISGEGTTSSPYKIGTNSGIQTFADHIIAESNTNDNIIANIETNNVINYRYVGSNPSNYVCLGGTQSNCSDGELYRIIGVFSDDTHGVAGKKLVKLVRANSIGQFYYDYKDYQVGSNPYQSGIWVDWSDAQLMYLLNGTNYLNSGYKNESSTPIHNWTSSNGAISDGTTIFYRSIGSYLNGGGTVNVPSKVTKGTNYTNNTITISGLNTAARNLVEETTWRFGTTPDDRLPDYWVGKIGLASVYDFYGADGGGENNNWLSYDYNITTFFLTYAPKYGRGGYVTFFGDYIPTVTIWCDMPTIRGLERFYHPVNPPTISLDSYVTMYQFDADYGLEEHDVFPALYLKENTIIESGDGTISSPYMLSLSDESVESIDVPISSAALIESTINTSINKIRIEGALVSDNLVSGLVDTLGPNSSINNFQINSELSAPEVKVFINSSLKQTAPNVLTQGYFNGKINSYITSIYDDSSTLSYTNVYATGDSISNLKYPCSTAGNHRVLHSLNSDNACYASSSSIISNLNSSLPLLYWKTTSGKLPELLISSDNIEPVISIKITTKNTSNQTVNTNYNSFKSNRSVITSSSAPSVTINSITEDTTFKTVQYYVSNGIPLTTAELDALSESSWTDYSDTFTTSTKGTYIYYFKVVDINNNVVYISSDYIVYDKITASYYNVDNNVALSGGSLNKNTTLKVVYSTEGNSLESNYNAAKYQLNVQGIPVGTIISFKVPANSYGERLVYTYKVTGSTGASIKLSDFKLSGTTTATNYDSSNLNIEGSGLEVYYNFRDTVGGTFNTTLGLSDNTNLILQDSNPRTINITSTTDSISLSNNQSSTMTLNSVGNHNIRYTATSSNQEGYYYLKFNILDSNNNVVDSSLMKGLSIVYSSKEYRPDNSGTITIPIGTFKSTIDVTLKVNYLTNDKPGTYFIGAKLYKKEASSSYNKFSISTNYINNNSLKQQIEIKRNNNLAISPGDTLTFSVSDYTQDSNVGSVSFNTYIELYKKNFNTNTYSSMTLSSVSSTSFMASNANEVMYPNAGAANINIKFTNALTPGAYKLDVRIKNGSATIKTESLYFIVVGG